MHTQQNNFYRQIKKEQGDLAKEIEEIKKFQVNQTLMGFRSVPLDKMEDRINETRNEIIEMPCEIAKFVHDNAAKKRNIFHGALKNFEQGGPSNHAEPPPNPTGTPMDEAEKES
ncbi:hypothetical protein PIB30_075372 [Stylosanthes scabra]|uniref:Uncharacterized protein n=1 Tax=Stylosanthes scabra TaxID=79078 RepID=A0ABU6YQN5_9FABA|nr:hypothetical protein [Stylosanthes scabra]